MHFAAAGIIPTVAITIAITLVAVEFGGAWGALCALCVGAGALWALTFVALRARDVANQPPSGE